VNIPRTLPRRALSRAVMALIVIAAVSCMSPLQPARMAPAKLKQLVLAGSPGPMSIPLAYLVVNNKLADVADSVKLVMWEDQTQLKAIVAGQQADFVTLPSNNAAIFYSKGLKLQLLDISVWNASFGVSADASLTSISKAKGKRVVVPFQGSVPDLLFQYIAKAQGLDPVKDFDLRYTPNPQQAAQMILAGQADLAILPEPLATTVLLKAPKLNRVFSIADEWAGVTDGKIKMAISGTAALQSVQDRPDVIDAFMREYAAAVAWMVENPEDAGKMAEEQLPQLGLKAGPTAQALKNMVWKYVPAADSRADAEAFFTVLKGLSPDVIGGKLPDDNFYYGGAGAAATTSPTSSK